MSFSGEHRRREMMEVVRGFRALLSLGAYSLRLVSILYHPLRVMIGFDV
jgi:hypothetical protein